MRHFRRLGSDEAIAFVGIEELYGSDGHEIS
jgi:hypothetical protein